MLTAVVFAIVLLFAGLATKARQRTTQTVLTALALSALAGCVLTLVSFPVEI